MARSACLALFMLLVIFTYPANGRRLINTLDSSTKKEASPVEMSLYLNALPKGTVPASTPSKKGHASITNEKLITRHLITVDRILRSVPSPGVGN
ncbi:putative precursor of CEP13/CEP14 [Helianthus anomalus]